jgi:uncharacterized protein (TIGR00725 family)
MLSLVVARQKMSTKTADLFAKLAARQGGPHRLMQPLGIIGPGDGGDRECNAAYEVAHAFASSKFAIVSGGRGGVMEAASRGAYDAGGVSIGILPEGDVSAANPYLTVAVPTGMGEMRNAVIARSSICLVAIGGGMGTVSEMALGLKWEKKVFTLYEEIWLPGAKSAKSIEQLIEMVAAFLFEAQR